MITIVERAMEAGHSVLIENMGETIDAMLNPVITRWVGRHDPSLKLVRRTLHSLYIFAGTTVCYAEFLFDSAIPLVSATGARQPPSQGSIWQ